MRPRLRRGVRGLVHGQWHDFKSDGDSSGHLCLRRSDLLRQGECALVPVSQTHGGAQLILRDLLEAQHVLPRLFHISEAAVGTGDAEFRGGMIRVQAQRLLESLDGLLVLLQVRGGVAHKIARVSVAGGDLRSTAE